MTHNNGIIVGWDSVETGVDEFELQERHFDTVDQMAQPPRPSHRDRHVVSRLKRDLKALNHIALAYGLRTDERIAIQNVKDTLCDKAIESFACMIRDI